MASRSPQAKSSAVLRCFARIFVALFAPMFKAAFEVSPGALPNGIELGTTVPIYFCIGVLR
jgi:hypothetical protein